MSKVNRAVDRPQSKRRIALGLTGGIASGKSAALKVFRRLGAATVDCDVLAREAVLPGRAALRKIRKVFGPAVFSGKKLNRAAMGTLVFSNPSARRKLEAIIHPEVIRKVKESIRRQKKGLLKDLLVVDVPLLFEAKLKKLFDKTVVVWVPGKTQVQRLMRRNRISRPDALRRLDAQLSLSKKRKMADFTINNSRSLKDSERQIRLLYRRLTAHP